MDQGDSSDSEEVFQDASDQSSSLPLASPSTSSDTAILEKITRRKRPRVSVSSFAAAIKRGQASTSSSMADSTFPSSPSTPDSFKFVEPTKRKPRVSVSSFAMALRKNQTISDQTTSNSSEPTTPADARPLAITKRKPRVSVGDFLKAFNKSENETGSNSSTLPSEPPTPEDAKPLTVNSKKPRVSVGSFVQALQEDSSTDDEPELMRERVTSNDTVPSPNLSSPALAQSRPASRKDVIADKPAEIPTTPHNMRTNQTVQDTSESIASVNSVTSVECLTTDEVSEKSPAAERASVSEIADVSHKKDAKESGKEEVQEEEDKEEETDQEEDDEESASDGVTAKENEASREYEDKEEETDREEDDEESASDGVPAKENEASREYEEKDKEEDDEEPVSAEVQANKNEAPEESEDEEEASEAEDDISEVQVEKVQQVSMQKEVLISPTVRRLAKASTPARNSTIARIAASKSLNLSPIPAASVSSAKLFAQETRKDEEDSEEEEDDEESYESAKEEEDEEENKRPAAKPEPVPAAQNAASKSFLLNPFKGKAIKIPEVLRQAYAISISRPPPAIVPLSERAKTFPPEKRKALEVLEADLKRQRLAREEPKPSTFKKPVKKPTTVSTRKPKAKIPGNVTSLSGNRKNFLFYSRLKLKKDAAVAVHDMVDKFTEGILEVASEYCEEKGISDFNDPEHFYEIMKRMGLVENHHEYTSMVIETMWNDYHKYLLPVGMPPNWEALQKMAMMNKKK